MPYCRHHGDFGHGSEGCNMAKSNTAATKSDIVESEYDTEEDEMEIPSAQASKRKPS